MTSKKIVFANDYRGVELKKELLQYAKNKGLDVEDIGIEEGSSLDFVDISRKLAKHLHGTDNFGILICGSGQGVSIAVNRYSDMRAAMCRTPEDAVSVRQKLNAKTIATSLELPTAKYSHQKIPLKTFWIGKLYGKQLKT